MDVEETNDVFHTVFHVSRTANVLTCGSNDYLQLLFTRCAATVAVVVVLLLLLATLTIFRWKVNQLLFSFCWSHVKAKTSFPKFIFIVSNMGN